MALSKFRDLPSSSAILPLLLSTTSVLLLIKAVSTSIGEPQVPCFFVFGDSTSDNGNNNYRQTTAKVDFLPYGIDFPDGPTGRFTNGRNIADVIAELLGFEEFMAPFANATDKDILRGVNYASGGAGILDHTGRAFYGDIISMNEQLRNHETLISRLVELSNGSTSRAEEHLRRCIYYVAMGNNDYLAEYLPKLYSTGVRHSPEKYASFLIRRFSKQLQRLYKNGARKVAVSALGRLGCVPEQVAAYGSFERDSSSCIRKSNEIVHIFDGKLKILVEDLNRRFPDARFAYIGNRALSHGNITNLMDPCCGEATGGGNTRCLPGTIPCNNRDGYMFWDEVHPSEAAYLIFGKSAYDDMSPLLRDDDSFVDVV